MSDEYRETIDVEVGEELFQFTSFERWVNKAPSWYGQFDNPDDTLTVDAKGRVCMYGAHFMRARDENAFPVRVYRI